MRLPKTSTPCFEIHKAETVNSEASLALRTKRYFVSLQDSLTNRRKSTESSNLEIRWLRFERDCLFMFKFKTTLNNSLIGFQSVNLEKKSPGRPLANLQNIKKSALYPIRRDVTEAKNKDMLDLLPYIPPVVHGFYKHFPCVSQPTRLSCASTPDCEDETDECHYV